MVYKFPILFTHTTPINHDDMFSQIVYGKDLSLGRQPNKKCCLKGTLFRHTLHSSMESESHHCEPRHFRRT
jgi:hypothetical protein